MVDHFVVWEIGSLKREVEVADRRILEFSQVYPAVLLRASVACGFGDALTTGYEASRAWSSQLSYPMPVLQLKAVLVHTLFFALLEPSSAAHISNAETKGHYLAK